MSVKIRLSPEEKLRIFIDDLLDNVKIAKICRRKEIWPREYYRIKEKALEERMEPVRNLGLKYTEKRLNSLVT